MGFCAPFHIFQDMDTGNDYSHWRTWTSRSHWPRHEDGSLAIRIFVESWAFESERFDGAWLLDDCTKDTDEFALARCLCRMLVVRVCANAVRRGLRGEDAADDIEETREYIEELELPLREVNAAQRVLSALFPYDANAVCLELLSLVWFAREEGALNGARCMALLAYEAALEAQRDDAASGAAHAISRLAILDECPRTARKWRGLAAVHTRRLSSASAGERPFNN